MNNIGTINDFLGSSKIALVGISRNEKKFGNYAYKDLKSKGLSVVPVHTEMTSFEGDRCYKSIAEIDGLSAVISVVNKSKTEKVLQEAKAAGINKVWIQQGTDTPEAISYAEENKMEIVKGECILMFTSGDKFPHNFHRFFVKLFKAYPK